MASTSAKLSRVVSREHARDAPVEHVDLAEIAEHDVRGLEIAMDDAARVRELDREADVGERAQQALARERRDRSRRRRASCAITSASVVPASCFITKNGWPSPSYQSSCTGTTAGCSSRPWIRASRKNRATRSGVGCSLRMPLDRDLAADLLVARGQHLAHAAAADHVAELVARAGTVRARCALARCGRNAAVIGDRVCGSCTPTSVSGGGGGVSPDIPAS